MQRTPYYLGIPLAAGIAAAIWAGVPAGWSPRCSPLLAVLMLYNFGLGAYHSGVEWGWWEGPATCAPSIAVESAGAMFETLQSGAHGPSCTEAVWRFAGLSFAGWNVLDLARRWRSWPALVAIRARRSYGSSSASQ